MTTKNKGLEHVIITIMAAFVNVFMKGLKIKIRLTGENGMDVNFLAYNGHSFDN